MRNRAWTTPSRWPAIMQAIVAKLQKLRRQNVTFRSYKRRLIDGNRWRASRYGRDGKLIDFRRKCEMDERELLHEMLELSLPKSMSWAMMPRLRTSRESSAKALARIDNWRFGNVTHNMRAVVDHIVTRNLRRADVS